MSKYQFWVEGEPVAKARPRVVKGNTFTPEKTRIAEDNIGWAFKSAYPGNQVNNLAHFRVEILFFLTNYKNGKPRKFDLDNGCKTVLDALNGIVWGDDSQVTKLTLEKVVTFCEPKTLIRIRA